MSRHLGQATERRACAELQRHGLRLLERNFHSRHGELDLIMRDGEEVVFVEVRMRRHAGHGGASASITPLKRRHLVHAAASWLQRHPECRYCPCRFDVVTCEGDAEGAPLQWIRAAFEAG